MSQTYLKTRSAAKLLNVSVRTLREYENKGYLHPLRPDGCNRRYEIEELENFLRPQVRKLKPQGTEATKEKDKIWKVSYARVSSKKQEDDLHRQVAHLKEKYPDHEIIWDVGSGINFKTRKQFRRIFEKAQQGYSIKLAVAHKDRLCRFGFDLCEYLISLSGGEIICEDNELERSREEELAEDLLSIVQIFNCRQTGRRRYKNKGESFKQIDEES